jgi:diadenosine tetraphosphatase ApaH/serine/threonine PP2A family protein phosphatase
MLVHGNPGDLMGFPYIMYLDDAMDAFRASGQQVCFFGHSHLPGVFTSEGHMLFPEKLQLNQDSRYLVNVGSVGQPRNLDPRACYVLYDDDTRDVEYIRLPYDIEATREAMAQQGLPAFLSSRLSQGR